MEPAKPQFNVSATLIRRLAEELFRDTASALAELVKNAYDADAGWIRIEVNTVESPRLPNLHFTGTAGGFVRVQDDGKGMSAEAVRDHWMNFSISSKDKLEETERKRGATGGQGMGRLGTYRLGKKVELFTATGDAGPLHHVAFDWSDFSEKRAITNIPVFSQNIPGETSRGTTLVIHPLNDSNVWTGESLKSLRDLLKEKVAMFLDKSSFQLEFSVDGQTVVLGNEHVVAQSHQIYLENVWQRMSPELIQEVIEFWTSNKMLRPGFSSDERARQVVLIIRSEATKKIVGVSTAMVVRFKQLNDHNFFYYRSIVLPEFRQPGLASKMIVETRDFLESISKPDQRPHCIGLITFVENPKIKQAKREAVWPASQMVFMGLDKDGRHMRVYYFKGARV